MPRISKSNGYVHWPVPLDVGQLRGNGGLEQLLSKHDNDRPSSIYPNCLQERSRSATVAHATGRFPAAMTIHSRQSPTPTTTVKSFALRACLNIPLNIAIAAEMAIQVANREMAIFPRKSRAAALGSNAKYTRPIMEIPTQTKDVIFRSRSRDICISIFSKKRCRAKIKGTQPTSTGVKDLAEREGFEPSVQVLARTTV